MSRRLMQTIRLNATLLTALACTIVGFNVSGHRQKPVGPRRPLPKPAAGPRGFDQSSGRDASSRLIAAAATRGPLSPLAPAEGLCYDSRPMFVWEAAGTAPSYHFVLRDTSGSAEGIIYEADVTEAHLIYPPDAPALEPGRLYTWRVSIAGVLERKTGPPVSFFVLAGEDSKQVVKALKKARVLAPVSVAERLQQARIFAQFGVWYDAMRIASEVMSSDPSHAEAKAFYQHLIERLASEQQLNTGNPSGKKPGQ